jgi:hypothetical protein
MFGNDYNINPEIDLNSNKSLMRLMFAGPVKKKKITVCRASHDGTIIQCNQIKILISG